MNKLFFYLICGCLLFITITIVRAQEENINNQNVLKEIALKDKDIEMRKFAMSRLNDQSAFKEIALNDKDIEMRKFAISRLNDQNVFREIALNDRETPEIRKLAMSRLK